MTEPKARVTKWTDSKVSALSLPPDVNERRELVASGLYVHLRRRSTGALSKHWQYRAQVDGVRRWLSLGAYPAVGLAKAIDELHAHQKTHEAAKKGEGDHPVIAARFARKAAKAQPTVADAFDDWIADKSLGSARKGGKPVRQRTLDVLIQNFDHDIRDRIGDAKIGMLTKEAVQSCIDAPRKRGAPGAAAHVYRTLRGLVTFAIRRDFITGADPMRGVTNPKPYRRPDVVNAANDKEIIALLNSVKSSSMWKATKLIIAFQLLTGSRPTEARLATWREFNLERATWTIPAERVKTGKAFRIHLSPEAVAVVRDALSLKTETSEFVFLGIKGGALDKMAVARALSRLTERAVEAGGKKLSPHDLRRTFRTLLGRLGVPPHVAELCINHQEAETMRMVYDGHDYWSEMVNAWEKVGAHLASIQTGGAQIIPLRGNVA